MTGQTISHYKILAKMGEDALGTLYKAADREADRMVTLLALSPGIDRATLEASSTLRHPNIVRIEALFRWADADFAAMEMVEGESLHDFLERERPNRRYLLQFASQIAGALRTAHDAGLAHGPLDPAAIFISAQSQIKIRDFGFGVLAPPPHTEEARRALFRTGAPYISPEQIEGNRPDIRSDIFSFGALLYQMTTSRPAFRAATIAETWKAILEEEPKPIFQITSRAPVGMDKLVDRCLRKNPQRRFQRIDEIEPLLEKMAQALRENPAQKISLLSRNRAQILKIGSLALAGAAALAAAVLWWPTGLSPDAPVGSRFRQLTDSSGFNTDPAISADGNLIAYASDRNSGGNLDIWVQPADGGEPLRLTTDPADDSEPAFSPDGATIAFRSERNGAGVYSVPSKGGNARLIAPDGRRPRFSPDGRWIAYWTGPPGFAPKADGAYKTFIVPAHGGEPRRIRPDFASCTYPVWSPDSKSLLFVGRPDAFQAGQDAVDWWISSIDGERTHDTGACKLFHRIGFLPGDLDPIPGDWNANRIYFSAPANDKSNTWRADIDLKSLSFTNRPVRVGTGKEAEIEPLAAAGRVVYATQSFKADIWGFPVAVDEGKPAGELKRWTRDAGMNLSPSLSADGAKLLFQSNRSGDYHLMLLDGRTGKESAVSASPQEELWPIVSPDGSKVAWSERRIGKFEQFYKSTAGGPTEVLCEDCGLAVSGWSSDGAMALVDSFRGDRSRLAISVVKLDGLKKTVLLEDPQYELRQARFSPDGRSIVFAAQMDGGSARIYLAPFREQPPVSSKEWIALTSGNAWETSPQWPPDGKLIYYTSTRDGYRCVWAQRLGAGAIPSGEPFAVYHFHTARRSPARLPFGNMDLSVAHGQVLVSLGELSGNIWTAKVSE